MAKRKKLKPKPSFYLVILLVLSIVTGIAIMNLLDSMPEEDEPEVKEPAPQFEKIQLDQGLVITKVDEYAGMYMEDGSNETVSDVMMIVVENTADQDLQYAEIQVMFNEEVREFEISNLPSQASAVLLEQSRLSLPQQLPSSAVCQNVVFFDEVMNDGSDLVEVSGASGIMNIRNVSEQPLSQICVYYKYSASDLYYGGITFRVKLDGILEAQEVRQVATGHYDPQQCTIVMVTTSE